jgi:hypothetical protein
MDAAAHCSQLAFCGCLLYLKEKCKKRGPPFSNIYKELPLELLLVAVLSFLPYRLRSHGRQHQEKMTQSIDIFFNLPQDICMDRSLAVKLLSAATMMGEKDVLERLLREKQMKDYINCVDSESQANPLRFGIRGGYLETIEVLFDYGADAKSIKTEIEGNVISAIHHCVDIGNNDEMIRIVEMLLRKGEPVDKGKETAFCTAVQVLHLKMADCLVSHGANTNAVIKSVTDKWFPGPLSEYSLTILGFMIASCSLVAL